MYMKLKKKKKKTLSDEKCNEVLDVPGICVASLKLAFFAAIVVAKCVDNVGDTREGPVSTVKLVIC